MDPSSNFDRGDYVSFSNWKTWNMTPMTGHAAEGFILESTPSGYRVYVRRVNDKPYIGVGLAKEEGMKFADMDRAFSYIQDMEQYPEYNLEVSRQGDFLLRAKDELRKRVEINGRRIPALEPRDADAYYSFHQRLDRIESFLASRFS
jgi:hypothetical protein